MSISRRCTRLVPIAANSPIRSHQLLRASRPPGPPAAARSHVQGRGPTPGLRVGPADRDDDPADSTSGARPVRPARSAHASRTRSYAPAVSATVLNGMLNSSAYRAASSGVRFGPAAADDDRRTGHLHRLGQGGRVHQPVVVAVVAVRSRRRGRPQPGDHLELLGQPVEALADRRERDAVRGVLRARTSPRRCPARPGRRSSGPPARRSSPAGRAAGRWPTSPACRAGSAGLPGQRGQGHPGVRRAGQARRVAALDW